MEKGKELVHQGRPLGEMRLPNIMIPLEARAELEGKTIEELLKPFKFAQQEFLVYRVLGLDRHQSLRAIGLAKNSYVWWRGKNTKFRYTEKIILEERDRHVAGALGWFMTQKGRSKAMAVLAMLLQKGIDGWDNLKKEDKVSVLDAVKIMLRMDSVIMGGGKKSYEEMVFKLTRQIQATDVSMIEGGG